MTDVDPYELDRAVKQLRTAELELAGLALAVAAVIAALPQTVKLETPHILKNLEELVERMRFPHEVLKAGRQSALQILAAARASRDDRSDPQA
jgi:hypothetical protein